MVRITNCYEFTNQVIIFIRKFVFHSLSAPIIFIFFILFLFSCRPKEIDIDVSPPEPKLVVSSQIIPYQTMLVSLTKSFSALAEPTQNDTVTATFLEDVLVEDATVTVSYLGITDTLEMIAPGVYGSVTTLQEEYGTYTLNADDRKGMKITASSVLLPKVSFDTVYPILTKNSSDTIVEIEYSFSDIPLVDNWYVVNYYSKISTDTSRINLDINYFFGRGNNLLVEFDLLNDQTFSGEKYFSKKKLMIVRPTDTIAVTLSNISEGYFKFLNAYKKSSNLFNQLTGEPIDFPSNVQNGYGYFNTHYPDVRTFDLNTY